MLLRMWAAWCTAATVLLLGTVAGFRAVEGLYAGIYAAREAERTAHWTISGTLPRQLDHGVPCGEIPLEGATLVGQTFKFAADQSIAGIDVHALRPGPGSPRPCRWRFFDLTSDPSRQSPLREGLAELGDRRAFLRVHFDPLELGGGKSYELQLGAGDGDPTGLILPLFGAPRPWGILSVQSDPQGPPVDRADQCLCVRVLQVPQQE